MAGYDPEFIPGHKLPLPKFRRSLARNILRSDKLRAQTLADYDNYSVVTDKVRRAAVFAAANIDVNALKRTKRKDSWKFDKRIGADYQLGEDYYYKNDWDRGHLAMRESAGWGRTRAIAQHAADETFYYANAAPQHKNFNPDEWQELESWVNSLGGKVTCYTGPIYGQSARSIHPVGLPIAVVPAGFFKVICFIDSYTHEFAVRAFIMYQDNDAIADPYGRRTFNLQRYQVSVKEIETLTGLEFDNRVYEANPLLFRKNLKVATALNITSFPERVEVDRPGEIIDPGQPRVSYRDDEVGVYLSAALVDPTGADHGKEWVSILNLTPEPIQLKDWKLKDQAAREVACPDVTVAPGEARAIGDLNPVHLNNRGGFIELYRGEDRVDRVAYTRKEISKAKHQPIVFAYRTDW